MPWTKPQVVPFSSTEVSSQVPPSSGVYGLVDADTCLFVGESWNLKARLLELTSSVSKLGNLTVVYELCPDDERWDRKRMLSTELVHKT